MPGVLIVDDDALVLRALRRRKLSVARLFTAQDAESTLEIVTREDVHVVVVDLFLGKTWGIDLVPRLRSVGPDLHIALASAALRPDHVLLAMRAGANDVIEKPFEISSVLARIEGGPADNREPRSIETLDQNEHAHIARVFAESGGNIAKTARWLGITRQRLVRKLEQLRAVG